MPILPDAVASSRTDLLQVVRKSAAGQCPRQRITPALRDRRELVEQRTEDRFLVRKVVVQISSRYSGRIGNLPDGGGAKTLMGKKLQRRVENLSPALLGSELTGHFQKASRERRGRQT